MTLKVGVLAPESSWHFQDLKRACGSFHRNIELVAFDFATLEASVGVSDTSTFRDERSLVNDIDVLLVRTMPKGSLQQVVFRMDVLHRLAGSGVHVVNAPRSMEIAIDKYLSLSLMAESGIPVPEFVVCQTVKQGIRALEQLGGDAILKPIFGSMGKNIHRVNDAQAAKVLMEEFVSRGEVLYLQKFINHGGSDIRILVVGDDRFAMRRQTGAGQWVTNLARGASAEPYEPTAAEVDLAFRAARANACEIAGVDLVYEKGSSQPMVLEVNASPGWEGIQKVCEADVAISVLKSATTNLG